MTPLRVIPVVVLSVLVTVVSACAPTAAPPPTAALPAPPAPTAAPPAPTAVPPATTVAKPTEAPRPTAVPAPAFDMKASLDKYFSALPDGFGTIAPTALKDQMATKPFLLDVREPQEIADNGYIDGSVNISVRALAKNLDKLPAKDQAIVAYCASGHRGALGMMSLQMLGYTNVKSLVGGFNAWKAANLPVATGTPAAPVVGKAVEADRDLLAALDRYLSTLPNGFGTIAPAAMNEQLTASKPFQLDVREAKEIADNGYVAGSVNVPIRTLIKGLDKLPPDKTAALITECGNGHRSALAMMGLNLLGYPNVKTLVGGIGAWKSANLPIVK